MLPRSSLTARAVVAIAGDRRPTIGLLRAELLPLYRPARAAMGGRSAKPVCGKVERGRRKATRALAA